MPKIDQKYTSLAKRLVEHYQLRNKLYRGIDDIFYLRNGIPEGLPGWVQEVKSTEPRDAVMTAARVLSTLEPQFRVDPMYSNEDSKRRANQMELALRWNYLSASRRPGQKPHWQTVLNAVRYAQPVMQVVYLPYQIAVAKALKKDTNRLEAAKRFGDFHFLVHDPGNVYPLWSDFGLEAVLLVRVVSIDTFEANWGANEALRAGVPNDARTIWVSQFELWTHERRIVWGAVGEGDKASRQELVYEGNTNVVLDVENDLGFIPIAVRRWGDEMSTQSDQEVLPLLSGVAMSGQWEMLNVLFSMDATLAWKRAAKPVGVHTSATRQPPALDYTEPVSTVELGPGESWTDLPPDSVDPHIASQYANFRNLIWQSTVARALQSLEFPGNTAYSTVNQVLQAATQSISPYRVLAEDVIAEASQISLAWIHYWGEKGHDASLYGQYPKKDEKYGQDFFIPWDEIDPYGTYVQVILRPDVPLDRQQQVNTAAVLYDRFPITAATVLEDIGFENMDQEALGRFQENLDIAYMAAEASRPGQEVQFEFQARMEALRAKIQQALIASQQPAPVGPGGAQPTGPGGPPNPAMENAQGLANNPAAGGSPPIQAAPGQILNGNGG